MFEMIIVFFFVSVLLSCLPLLLHSATYHDTSTPICPESFSCSPSLAPFKYPFYNATDTSQCGLIKVHCSTSNNLNQIQLGNHLYQITARPSPGSNVFIRNTTFQKLIEEGRCDALEYNFTSPTPLLFSISIPLGMTVYKCRNDSSYARTFFEQHNYNSYNRCKDHNFYYSYSLKYTEVPSDLPHSCQVIQLPVKQEREEGYKLNHTNIFSLLSADFSIFFRLTTSCEGCHKKGAQCHTDNGQFQCLGAKKEILGRKPGLIITLAALSVGAMVTLIVIVLCFRITLTWRTKANNDVNEEIFLKNHEFLAPKRYSYSQVKKMTNSFRIKLGQGGFGSVYKGALSNGNLVAVKILSESKGKGEDFINEVASVGRTSHVNIVSLVGFCLEGHQRALIYEFMPNGSLEKFIYNQASSRNSQLGWEKLHQIAIGIARGLEYLHSGCNTRILHFDIKPHNILLDKNLCPKISDFGLAKLFPNERSMISMSCMRGTPGYIAPELVSRSFGQVSHKSDVYSYGMMVLEMVGGRKNIEVEVDHTSEIYFPHWIYKKVEFPEEKFELHGIVSDEENEMARKMIIVGLWCIQTNPLSRPTITKVLEMLEGDLELLEIPPKPYLSSPPRLVDSSSTN